MRKHNALGFAFRARGEQGTAARSGDCRRATSGGRKTANGRGCFGPKRERFPNIFEIDQLRFPRQAPVPALRICPSAMKRCAVTTRVALAMRMAARTFCSPAVKFSIVGTRP